MADIKFSQLPNLGNITSTTIIPVVATGQNFTVTGANLQTFVNNTTGNVTGGNIITSGIVSGTHAGSGAQLTNLPAANIVGTVANATFATSASTATSATTAGTVTTNAQPNITSVGTLSSLTVSGNIGTGGILTDGYYYANGTPVSFAGTYSNANVASYLLTSNSAIGTGTVTGPTVPTSIRTTNLATNILSTASLATIDSVRLNSFVGTSGNGTLMSAATGFSTNQAITATGNVTGGNIVTAGQAVVTGNVTGGNLNTAGQAVVTGNISGGNLSVSGRITAVGNISGNFILGNGSQLTGLPATYSNSNVTSLLAAFGSNTISTTGNITAGNFVGNGSVLTGLVTTTTNQSVAGNKTFTGTTTLGPYIETTASSVNTGTNFVPTMSNGPVQRVTANNNFTLAAPSGMVTGQSITLIITQDGTGNKVMTPNAVYKFAYGSSANSKSLSTLGGAIDMLSIFYDGSNYLVNMMKGYS